MLTGCGSGSVGKSSSGSLKYHPELTENHLDLSPNGGCVPQSIPPSITCIF